MQAQKSLQPFTLIHCPTPGRAQGTGHWTPAYWISIHTWCSAGQHHLITEYGQQIIQEDMVSSIQFQRTCCNFFFFFQNNLLKPNMKQVKLWNDEQVSNILLNSYLTMDHHTHTYLPYATANRKCNEVWSALDNGVRSLLQIAASHTHLDFHISLTLIEKDVICQRPIERNTKLILSKNLPRAWLWALC